MTEKTYKELKRYVGSTDDFTDDLLNYGYTKGRREGYNNGYIDGFVAYSRMMHDKSNHNDEYNKGRTDERREISEILNSPGDAETIVMMLTNYMVRHTIRDALKNRGTEE